MKILLIIPFFYLDAIFSIFYMHKKLFKFKDNFFQICYIETVIDNFSLQQYVNIWYRKKNV